MRWLHRYCLDILVLLHFGTFVLRSTFPSHFGTWPRGGRYLSVCVLILIPGPSSHGGTKSTKVQKYKSTNGPRSNACCRRTYAHSHFSPKVRLWGFVDRRKTLIDTCIRKLPIDARLLSHFSHFLRLWGLVDHDRHHRVLRRCCKASLTLANRARACADPSGTALIFSTFVLFVLLYSYSTFPLPTLVLDLEVEGTFQFVFPVSPNGLSSHPSTKVQKCKSTKVRCEFHCAHASAHGGELPPLGSHIHQPLTQCSVIPTSWPRAPSLPVCLAHCHRGRSHVRSPSTWTLSARRPRCIKSLLNTYN